MLVFTRRLGDRVVIDGNGRTVVTLISIGDDRIKLGFDAPVDIAIDRQEIFDRKQAEVTEDLEDLAGKDTDVDE